MRATTITNLASLERALTNVNGVLMAIEGARTSQDFANIIAGGKQTTDDEWAAIEMNATSSPLTHSEQLFSVMRWLGTNVVYDDTCRSESGWRGIFHPVRLLRG